MKKVMILFFFFLFVCGCFKNNIVEKRNEDFVEENETNVEEKKYEDSNPITLGLYDQTKLINEYKFSNSSKQDIGVFTTYFSNELEVYGNIKNIYLDSVSRLGINLNNYKIGYYIEFSINNENHEYLILSPSSMYELSPYLYVYLYDDINQTSSWYSHVEEDQVNNDTIFTSIKLFQLYENFDSPIYLTVFSYDGMDDFDNNKYIGNSKYTIKIIPN